MADDLATWMTARTGVPQPGADLAVAAKLAELRARVDDAFAGGVISAGERDADLPLEDLPGDSALAPPAFVLTLAANPAVRALSPTAPWDDVTATVDAPFPDDGDADGFAGWWETFVGCGVHEWPAGDLTTIEVQFLTSQSDGPHQAVHAVAHIALEFGPDGNRRGGAGHGHGDGFVDMMAAVYRAIGRPGDAVELTRSIAAAWIDASNDPARFTPLC